MKKILIYDDEEWFAEALKESLTVVRDDFNVKILSESTFGTLMRVLKNRRSLEREFSHWRKSTLLDEASIFIISFDLIHNKVSPFLTGEEVAYLARCFSKCGLIIVVDQYGHNPFDLSLRGHPKSFADLNVGQDQLSNPDLWRGTWGGTRRGFRSWSWPSLPDYLCTFKKRVDDVEEHIDSPICEVIGFDPELFALLPRSISQFLGGEPETVTFREFVTESGNCLRHKDALHITDEILARIGAARISKWLERSVLPEQDVLVDAPHLVSRYLSLMTGNVKKIETWNQTAQLTSYEELGLDISLIEPFRLKKSYWLSRPVWFWDKLRECRKIEEVRGNWSIKSLNCAFCEDASRFYVHGECTEFLADTESPFSYRFVRGFKKVDYRPKVRFTR